MWKKFLILCLASFYLAGCTTVQKAPEQSVQAQLKSLQRQVQDQENDIAMMKQELDMAKAPRETVSTSVAIKKTPSTVSLSGVTSKNIQMALANAGYYDGKIDGKIGTKSTEAIKKFQKDNGLKADGVVGAKTWERLSEYLGIK